MFALKISFNETNRRRLKCFVNVTLQVSRRAVVDDDYD